MDTDVAVLVERCRNGDIAAFEPLVEKYRQRVWRLAYNVLRDREEAWDVAQDAFIKAFQALPNFRGQSAFYTWLFRIVMNVATDRARVPDGSSRATCGCTRGRLGRRHRPMIPSGVARDRREPVSASRA